MKLTTKEGSENYTCTVVKLPVKQDVPGLDNLKRVAVFGNDVLVGKDASEDELYLFFPAECKINANYLAANNEYRHSENNIDETKKGFFEDSGRVKAIKFKGVISTGYLAPVSSLDEVSFESYELKLGDEFTDLDGITICEKYKVIRTQSTTTKESRFNKKLKRFNKLVPNQFRFHESTSHLAKNLHQFQQDDIIVITEKFHGTSAVFANVLINKELTWKEKIAKFFGVDIITTKHDSLYSSRSVIKNQYINKEATAGYYNEDIWAIVHEEIKSKIEPGITIYGEIVGYLPSGAMIQKQYDYGCDVGYPMDPRTRPQHKFLVYRMTYTKPDGNTIEFTWQQIKNYCAKYSLEHVKELFYGTNFVFGRTYDVDQWLAHLQEKYLEKDCIHCVNKVPAEGIVVRRDGQPTYSAYKLKSKRFLEKETKQLDSGEINIEDDCSAPFESDEMEM